MQQTCSNSLEKHKNSEKNQVNINNNNDQIKNFWNTPWFGYNGNNISSFILTITYIYTKTHTHTHTKNKA